MGHSNPGWVQIQGVTAKEVNVSTRPQEGLLTSREGRRNPGVEPSPQDEAAGAYIRLNRRAPGWRLATYIQV